MLYEVTVAIEKIASNKVLPLEEKQRGIRECLEDFDGANGLDDKGRVKRKVKLQYMNDPEQEEFHARQLKADADTLVVNNMERLGWTPLLTVCQYNEPELVNWLIEHEGAAVDLAKDDGATALHVAAEHNLVDVARVLFKWGADINYKRKIIDDFVETPLDRAICHGHLDFVKFLVETGIEISTKDHAEYMRKIELFTKQAHARASAGDHKASHNNDKTPPSVDSMEAIAEYFAQVKPNVESRKAAPVNRSRLFSGNDNSATSETEQDAITAVKSVP